VETPVVVRLQANPRVRVERQQEEFRRRGRSQSQERQGEGRGGGVVKEHAQHKHSNGTQNSNSSLAARVRREKQREEQSPVSPPPCPWSLECILYFWPFIFILSKSRFRGGGGGVGYDIRWVNNGLLTLNPHLWILDSGSGRNAHTVFTYKNNEPFITNIHTTRRNGRAARPVRCVHPPTPRNLYTRGPIYHATRTRPHKLASCLLRR